MRKPSLVHLLAALSATTAFWGTSAVAAIGDIFVVNDHAGTIGEYTTDGQTVNASLITGLKNPYGIAVSGTNLFVTADPYYFSQPGSGSISEYTTSGALVNASLVTGLTDPLGIAVSGSNLFVLSAENGAFAVGEYTTSGTTVNASLIPKLGSGDQVVYLAVSGENIFVSNYAGGYIGKYTTDGQTVNASLITGLDYAMGIAVDGTDLYAVNFWPSGYINKYNTDGVLMNSPLFETGSYSGPQGLTMFGGNLFVANFYYGTIGEYNTDGQTVNASLITGLTGFPTDIAVAPEVPEPSTLIVWSGLCAMGLIAAWRRRKRAA